MAAYSVAVAKGEWQLDPDGIIRLHVRPTITVIKPGGVTNVPSFTVPDGRRYPAPCESPGIVFRPTANASPSFGQQYWPAEIRSAGLGLEPVDPDYTLTVFGYYGGGYPTELFLAVALIKTNIVWRVDAMDPYAIPVYEAHATNDYDLYFLNGLKRMRCNECRTTAVPDSGTEGTD